MNPKTGTCPKCFRAPCHIYLFYQGERHKFFRDTQGDLFSYMKAVSQSVSMQRDIDDKKFNPVDWNHVRVKERLFKNMMQKWLDQVEEEVESNELSYGSFHSYQSRAKNHTIPFLGNKDVREIRFHDLEEFKDSLPKKLKIATRKAIINDLKTAMRWMHRKGIIEALPPFPIIKGNDSESKMALSYEDQIEALKKIPDKHRDIFEFEFETGIRPGESCALKIKDLDFNDLSARICRTFTMRRIRESDKEGHKETIPLSDRAIEIAKKNSKERFPEDWLFINHDTKRNYTVQYLGKWWKIWTGLTCSHYEGSRHSFCTQIAESANDSAAQRLMRHADKRSTEKYTHHRPTYLRDVVNNRGKVVELKKSTYRERTLLNKKP